MKEFSTQDYRKIFKEYNEKLNLYGGKQLPTHEDRLYKWIHRLNPPRYGKGRYVMMTDQDLKKFAADIMASKDCTFEPSVFDQVMNAY